MRSANKRVSVCTYNSLSLHKKAFGPPLLIARSLHKVLLVHACFESIISFVCAAAYIQSHVLFAAVSFCLQLKAVISICSGQNSASERLPLSFGSVPEKCFFTKTLAGLTGTAGSPSAHNSNIFQLVTIMSLQEVNFLGLDFWATFPDGEKTAIQLTAYTDIEQPSLVSVL